MPRGGTLKGEVRWVELRAVVPFFVCIFPPSPPPLPLHHSYQIAVSGSVYGPIDCSKLGGREHGARIISGGRALYVSAESSADLDVFLRALSTSVKKPAPPASVPLAGWCDASGSDSGGNNSPAMTAGIWEGSVSGGSVSFAALRESALSARASASAVGLLMPFAIDIDGSPEVGSELRVRGANLENLCVAWFRASGDILLLDPGRDITADANVRFIPGATQHTYRLTLEDNGFRLGCSARPAAGTGGRWSVQAEAVRTVDAAVTSVRLALRPHVHNKYCDRRVRVCTSAGRYREGEILELVLRGPTEKFTVAWYRSAALVAPDGGEGAAASVHGDGQLSGLSFRRVVARPVEDLPPSPPDAAPAPSIVEIKASLTRIPPTFEPAGGARLYPIFSSDEGTMLLAAIVPNGMAVPEEVYPYYPASVPTGVVVSLPIGPVEAAPPRAREIWVEGEARVGALLLGNVYYYGGREQHCICSWVSIGDNGESREIKMPTVSRPVSLSPLPAQNSPAGGPGDAHPRALRISPDLMGCLIKFRVQPVRADSDEGHLESSRPTKEVSAAL